jgi:proline iminopeptidase
MRRFSLLLLLFALPLSAGTFKSHDGTVLHYDAIGKGSPVLLLSGGPGFSPDYLQPIAEKLAGKHRSILLHQRGTGRSTADPATLQMPRLVEDIEALRKHLDVPQLVIAGHSFGGIMAMMYAREHPDRIAALLLIDSGGPTLKSVAKFNATLESRFSDEEKARIKEWSDPTRLKEQHARAVLEIARAKTAAYFSERTKAHL